jgi:hypothetical protein
LIPEEIQEALANQIETYLGGTATPLENLQVVAYWNNNPTPPSVDVYPADPFQSAFRMRGDTDMRFIVRARVHTADEEAGQKVLLAMMNSSGVNSLGQAILQDKTLGGKCGGLGIEEVGGFQLMLDVGGEGSYMGATWTVRVVP